jgi:Zn-dependent metalloprotease
VFGRDMVLSIEFMADWGAIEEQRQKEINHDYKVGDKILLKKPGKNLRKLEAPRT